MPRITEAEIGDAVVRILKAQQSGSATIGKLKAELPDYVKLSASDRAPSLTRNGEQMWEQQVRNLVSHRNTAGNVIHDGHVIYRAGKLRLP
jgi:hypothetical protein